MARKTTKTATKKTAPKARRMNKTERAKLAAEYGPDTKGAELPEPATKDEAKQKAKDAAYLEKQKAREYKGAPIPATKVLVRRMEEFQNTEADCYLLIDEQANTYAFANTYRGGVLPASYKVESYRYELTDKAKRKLQKKVDTQGYAEVEVTGWPAWIVTAVPAKRKASKR